MQAADHYCGKNPTSHYFHSALPVLQLLQTGSEMATQIVITASSLKQNYSNLFQTPPG